MANNKSKAKVFMKMFITAFLLLLLSFSGYAASDKEIAELQGQCSKRAKKFFISEFGRGHKKTDDGYWTTAFTAHYNKRMNTCFILTTTLLRPSDKDIDILSFQRLSDVNEIKDYGSFMKGNKAIKPNYCVMLDKYCTSEDEWNSLVKPYMED